MNKKFVFLLAAFLATAGIWAEQEQRPLDWAMIAAQASQSLQQRFPNQISAITEALLDGKDTSNLLSPENSTQAKELAQELIALRIAAGCMNFEIETTEEPLPQEYTTIADRLKDNLRIFLASVPKDIKLEVNIKTAEYFVEHMHDERVSVFSLRQHPEKKRHEILESYRDKLARALSGEPIQSIFSKSPISGPFAGIRETLFGKGLQSKNIDKSRMGILENSLPHSGLSGNIKLHFQREKLRTRILEFYKKIALLVNNQLKIADERFREELKNVDSYLIRLNHKISHDIDKRQTIELQKKSIEALSVMKLVSTRPLFPSQTQLARNCWKGVITDLKKSLEE